MSINGKSYSASILADGTWQAAVPAADVSRWADGSLTISASAQDTSGNPVNIGTVVDVDLAPVAISINNVTDDNVLNAAEKAGIWCCPAPPRTLKRARPLPLSLRVKPDHDGRFQRRLDLHRTGCRSERPEGRRRQRTGQRNQRERQCGLFLAGIQRRYRRASGHHQHHQRRQHAECGRGGAGSDPERDVYCRSRPDGHRGLQRQSVHRPCRQTAAGRWTYRRRIWQASPTAARRSR